MLDWLFVASFLYDSCPVLTSLCSHGIKVDNEVGVTADPKWYINRGKQWQKLISHALPLIVSVLITQMSRVVLRLPAYFTRLKASVWFTGFALPSLHGTQLTTCPCQDMPKPKVRSTRTNKANRLFRYTRLIVNCISHWTFRPIPIPETPTYTSDDVTIILPTIATGGLVSPQLSNFC